MTSIPLQYGSLALTWYTCPVLLLVELKNDLVNSTIRSELKRVTSRSQQYTSSTTKNTCSIIWLHFFAASQPRDKVEVTNHPRRRTTRAASEEYSGHHKTSSEKNNMVLRQSVARVWRRPSIFQERFTQPPRRRITAGARRTDTYLPMSDLIQNVE